MSREAMPPQAGTRGVKRRFQERLERNYRPSGTEIAALRRSEKAKSARPVVIDEAIY
jgi:hypothetical protein